MSPSQQHKVLSSALDCFGTLVREAGEGTTVVPMVSNSVRSHNGSLLASVRCQYLGNGLQHTTMDNDHHKHGHCWIANRSVHACSVTIDLFTSGSFTQERTDNDELLTTFTLPEIPDVFVDPLALPSRSSVAAGSFVDWSMTDKYGDVGASERSFTHGKDNPMSQNSFSQFWSNLHLYGFSCHGVGTYSVHQC